MDALYLDLDGTLVEYTAPFEDIYAAAFDGLDADPPPVDAYSAAFFDALGDASDPFAAAIAETDSEVDPAAFSDTLVRTEASHVEAVPGAPEVLDAFADSHRLGVLTNGVGRAQRAKLDAVGLTDAFESIVVSGEVGVRKPDPEIYRVAEDRLPADGYAFVADDLDRDVRPVPETWRGVYLGPETPEDVPSISRLAGLRDIL